MATYSQDLRQRVLDAVEHNEGSLRQIARRFVVSLSFVVRLLQLHRRTGSLDPKPPAGGRPAALGPDDLERLKGVGSPAARRDSQGIASAARPLVQPHSHLARPGEVAALAQEEGPSRRLAGPTGLPGETAGLLRGIGRARPATAGLYRRERGQYVDGADLRPCPGRRAGLRDRPGPLGYDDADLRLAVVRSDGGAGLRGGHGHGELRELCGAGPGPGVAPRRCGDLGRSPVGSPMPDAAVRGDSPDPPDWRDVIAPTTEGGSLSGITYIIKTYV
jgi:hypothetical protein